MTTPIIGGGVAGTWVKCSERMPNEWDEVLGFWGSGRRGAAVVLWRDGEWRDPEDEDHSFSAPKFWMPLPAGPTP